MTRSGPAIYQPKENLWDEVLDTVLINISPSDSNRYKAEKHCIKKRRDKVLCDAVEWEQCEECSLAGGMIILHLEVNGVD